MNRSSKALIAVTTLLALGACAGIPMSGGGGDYSGMAWSGYRDFGQSAAYEYQINPLGQSGFYRAGW